MPSSTLGSRGDRGVWGDTRAPRPGSAGSAQFPAGRNLNGQKNAIHNLCGPSCESELWKMEKKQSWRHKQKLQIWEVSVESLI